MTEETRDCYRVLDLNPQASLAEIKEAYRDQLKAWHPDLHSSDPKFQRKATEKTKQINIAYQTITAYLRAAEEETAREHVEAERRVQEEQQKRANQTAEASAREQAARRAERAWAEAAKQAEERRQAESRQWQKQQEAEKAQRQKHSLRNRARAVKNRLGRAGRQWLAGLAVAACVVLLLIGAVMLLRTKPHQQPPPDNPGTPAAATIDKPSPPAPGSSQASSADATSTPSKLPPHNQVTPSAASTSSPFVNSLGMKFVPVQGMLALFDIWDVRVQDYQAFASETQREWPQPGFRQGLTDPVVNVSWEDAVGFCEWLTERERKQGLLSNRQSYRLPTDAEWSVAVGLGIESGATPREKVGKNTKAYPWGSAWPPPRGVGNYNPSLELDEYERTSPVGSFKANGYGLYDMGGNVWQWCEDFFDGQSGSRVLRGASWDSYGTDFLLSSFRGGTADGRREDVGFRCVLLLGSSRPAPATNGAVKLVSQPESKQGSVR
jgi:curved DNA-binding protein CbpA